MKSYQPKVGDRVIVPWWETSSPKYSSKKISKMPKTKKVNDLTGTVIKIMGGYYYIKINNNSKYDVIECYANEFKKDLTNGKLYRFPTWKAACF